MVVCELCFYFHDGRWCNYWLITVANREVSAIVRITGNQFGVFSIFLNSNDNIWRRKRKCSPDMRTWCRRLDQARPGWRSLVRVLIMVRDGYCLYWPNYLKNMLPTPKKQTNKITTEHVDSALCTFEDSV